MEYRGGIKDTLTHLCIGHRSRAVYIRNIPYGGSGAVCHVLAALACRGPHQRLLHMFHGLKDPQSLPGMSRMFDQDALVLAGG